MVWMDLIICSLSAAYAVDYCDRRWRAHSYDTLSTRYSCSESGGPRLQPKLKTRLLACVRHLSTRLHWATLGAVLIFKLAEYLPAGLAYGFQLPIYALAGAQITQFVLQLSTALRPSARALDPEMSSNAFQPSKIREEAWKHILTCANCRKQCEIYWRSLDDAGQTLWTPEIGEQLDRMTKFFASHT